MTSKPLVEICCGSAEDAIEAWLGGADCVELCSALFLGGLTPSLGSLLELKAQTEIKVAVMIRPRQGGFCYSKSDFRTALYDVELMLEHGADALVVGFLLEDGRVDLARTRAVVELADKVPVCFHRAIDVVPDWREALDGLMEIGVRRLLSSGQAPSAYEGRHVLREMTDYATGRIEVMPGGGIRAGNVQELLAVTGAREIHLGGVSRLMQDSSTQHNPYLRFGDPKSPPENEYKRVSRDAVAEFIASL